MMNWKVALSGLILVSTLNAQEDTTAQTLRKLYSHALTEQQGYRWLKELTDMGPRFAGSEQATASLLHFKAKLDSMGYQTQLQEVTVPRWVRGPQEKAWLIDGATETELAVTALGGSIGTEAEGLEAKVIEIPSFEALDTLPLEGKIAFYNIHMDPSFISTGYAYGSAVKQRWAGAIEASKRGAIGVVIRSLSSSINPYPHTGSMSYEPGVEKIPAAALSTLHAEALSHALKQNPDLKVKLNMACQWEDSVQSYNLIADWPGSEKPEEVILVSGHFDSWELGTGAHDDGTGVMHALESVHLLRELNFPIKRTLRILFYMNEEFGLNGAKTYARAVKNGEMSKKHVVAIESDGGGFTPKGFSMDTDDETAEKIKAYRPYFEPYGIYQFARGGSGADVGQLKNGEVILIGLRPDNHRYFEVHHSALDVFESVNAREFTMGSASLAALMWLMDRDDLTKAAQ